MKNLYLNLLGSLFFVGGSLNAYSADNTMIERKVKQESLFGHYLHVTPTITDDLSGIVIELSAEDGMKDHLQLLSNISYDMDLAEQNLTIKDIMTLQPYAQFMSGLDLSDNFIDNNFLEHLAMFTNLKKLNLSNNRFDDEGLNSVGKMKNLSSLNLYYNKVTPLGLRKLKGLNLTTLNVSCTFLENEGLSVILDLFPSLESLEVRACKIDENALPYLLEMPHLKQIDLSSNDIEPNALNEFIINAQQKGLKVITK